MTNVQEYVLSCNTVWVGLLFIYLFIYLLTKRYIHIALYVTFGQKIRKYKSRPSGLFQ